MTTSRGRKSQQKHGSGDMLDRLKYIQQVQKKDGTTDGHCLIEKGRITAFDGTFTIGVPIAEEMRCCPNTYAFVAALERCGETVSVVSDEKALTVLSGKMKVRVQTVPPDMLPLSAMEPDKMTMEVNDHLRTAINAVSFLAKEGEVRLFAASVHMDRRVVSSTNGMAALQFCHGFDLPPDVALPRKFCDLVAKNKSKLTHVGYTNGVSITFWFEDGSFVKTLLQKGGWPNMDRVFQYNVNFQDVPEDFNAAVNTVTAFAGKTGTIELRGDIITANGAEYECAGLPEFFMVNGKVLGSMAPLMEKIDMLSHKDRIFFTGFGGNVRGTIMGIRAKD